MPNLAADAILVTGLGVASGLGHGQDLFRARLFEAPDIFSVLKREGREGPGGEAVHIGIEMPEPPAILPPRIARTATFSARVAVAVLGEAWRDARLEDVDPARIGLVVGGTNLASREQALAVARYAGGLDHVPPRHGHMFFDSDIVGVCAAAYPIRGFATSVGAASASGLAAIIQAMDALRAGRVDVCIALGALQDLSGHELQALRAMGAMGSSRFADRPGEACRPMDADHDGFIYGEASAALVLTRADAQPGGRIYGRLLGSGLVADGTRGPEPCTAGQVRAAQNALAEAGLTPADIDYVNGHATGTPAGDWAELETYRTLGLTRARINATKSILGHGLSAAGTIEVAAVLMQMQEGRLHPTRNLVRPIDPGFDWVGPEAVDHRIGHALKLSFGFGGANAALVIGAPDGGGEGR